MKNKKKKLTAKEYSYFLLGRKDYTKKEITNKLKTKGFPKEEIDETMEDLLHYNYIDEQKYLENYFKYLLGRNKSPKEIKYKMVLKGFDKASIDETLNKYYYDQIEKNIIKIHILKYMKKYNSVEEKNNKIMKNLISKGFTFSYVMEMLKECNEN